MDSDANRIKIIIRYCERIEEMKEVFGNNMKDFIDKMPYQYACSFCIAQIGEQVNMLSSKLIAEYPEIHWKGIYRMRNVISHGYEEIDIQRVWYSIDEEIPVLKETCEKILHELERR